MEIPWKKTFQSYSSLKASIIKTFLRNVTRLTLYYAIKSVDWSYTSNFWLRYQNMRFRQNLITVKSKICKIVA